MFTCVEVQHAMLTAASVVCWLQWYEYFLFTMICTHMACITFQSGTSAYGPNFFVSRPQHERRGRHRAGGPDPLHVCSQTSM